jgi:hypothetical protein
MRIDSSGNVGIGTTSPNAKLEVYGQRVRINAAADPGVELANTTIVKGYMFYDTTNDLVTVRHASTGTGIAVNSSGNVGIGTTSPNASAILDAQSTTKGVRFPNMTTTQKNAISSPAAGLVVFDTTLAKLSVYSGSAWQTITSV